MTKRFIPNKNIRTEITVSSRKPQSLYIQRKANPKLKCLVLDEPHLSQAWWIWSDAAETSLWKEQLFPSPKYLLFSCFIFLFFSSLQVVWHSKWSKIPANRSFQVPDKYSHAVLHLLIFPRMQTCSRDLLIWEGGMQKARQGTTHSDKLLTGWHGGDDGSTHDQTLVTPPGHTNTQGNSPEPSQMWWMHG